MKYINILKYTCINALTNQIPGERRKQQQTKNQCKFTNNKSKMTETLIFPKIYTEKHIHYTVKILNIASIS